jgi:hypothetical protein
MSLTTANIQAKITAISATLDELYTKQSKDMSLEARRFVLQDIDKLRGELEYWEGRLARANNSKPRVASINLNSPGSDI